MLEIKTERDYLMAKKELEKLPTQITFSWVAGILTFVVGFIVSY